MLLLFFLVTPFLLVWSLVLAIIWAILLRGGVWLRNLIFARRDPDRAVAEPNFPRAIVISFIAVFVASEVRGLAMRFLLPHVYSRFDAILLMGIWFVVFWIVEALVFQKMMDIRFTPAFQVAFCTTLLGVLILLAVWPFMLLLGIAVGTR